MNVLGTHADPDRARRNPLQPWKFRNQSNRHGRREIRLRERAVDDIVLHDYLHGLGHARGTAEIAAEIKELESQIQSWMTGLGL